MTINHLIKKSVYMIYVDLQVGHLSPSFSSLNPQFPQIGTCITGLNELVILAPFSMTFLISSTLVPFGIAICNNTAPLRILLILLHSVISALFPVRLDILSIHT